MFVWAGSLFGFARAAAVRFGRAESGAVVVTTALMLVALSGFAGIGVDVGSWYLTRREIQTAADAAALGAAFEMAKPGYTQAGVKTAAESDAGLNGFGPANGATVTVTLAGDGKSVTVEIASPTPRYFSRLFLPTQLMVRARAVGGVGATGDPTCVVALDPSASEVVFLNSNGRINAPDCVVQVNSSSATAVGSGSGALVTSKKFCVVGGATGQGTYTPAPVKCPVLADPYAGLATPASKPCGGASVVNSGQTVTLSANQAFCNGLTLNANATVNLNPGTYIIQGNGLMIGSGAVLRGSGVALYMDGQNARFNLASNGTLDVSPPSTGAYRGIVLFESSQARTHNLDSTIRLANGGAIYFPYSRALFNSNGVIRGPAACTQLLVRSFDRINAGSGVTLDRTGMSAGNCTVPGAAGGTGRVALVG